MTYLNYTNNYNNKVFTRYINLQVVVYIYYTIQHSSLNYYLYSVTPMACRQKFDFGNGNAFVKMSAT